MRRSFVKIRGLTHNPETELKLLKFDRLNENASPSQENTAKLYTAFGITTEDFT